MARDEPLLRIRVPEELKARLEAAKDANRRSLNAEIRMRLERSFAAEADFAKHETATDARSKLAAKRVLSANLTSRPGPGEDRYQVLENEIEALKDRLKALENR